MNSLALVFVLQLDAAVFSVVLLLMHHGSKQNMRFANECYLIYNLLTSIIWCIEVILPVIALGSRALKGIATKLEIGICIYCIADSIRTVVRWKLSQDYTDVMNITALINIVIYTCIMVAVAR